jgi:hypothetical protein
LTASNPVSVANFLDVRVAQATHARVTAAQQILVEIENSNVEQVGKLPLKRCCIGGDAAQSVSCRDDCKSLAAWRQHGEISGLHRDRGIAGTELGYGHCRPQR